MKIWTFQKKEVLDKINKNGYYVVDARHTMSRKYKGSFRIGYEYMIKHLKYKCSKEHRNKYPIWGFPYNQTAAEFGIRELGYIKLELEIDESRILLSDFCDYHCVLNNFYCAINEDDLDNFWSKYYDDNHKVREEYNKEDVQLEIERSWIRIFDVKNKRLEDLQACFWEIKKEDIVTIEEIKEEDLLIEEDD